MHSLITGLLRLRREGSSRIRFILVDATGEPLPRADAEGRWQMGVLSNTRNCAERWARRYSKSLKAEVNVLDLDTLEG